MSWSIAFLIAAVSTAYYLGSLVGLALRLPPATTSLMWPPNTILTLALMLTRPRHWAWCLTAAFGAHLVVQGPTGWPPLLIVTLFATNAFEAVVGAGGFRWLAGPTPRIDSLRRMTIFILVVAVGAPLLSSFPDAAAVHWLQGEEFALVMRRRLSSNIMTALALLPALLALFLHLPRWLRHTRPRRWVEAATLAVTLVAAAQFAASLRVVRIVDVPITFHHTPLVVVLPFLLWAAVRFGTAGASLSLLVTALSAVQGAIAEATYADPAAAESSVLTLQTFLIMLSIPLLCLAALIEERYRARGDLADRLAFEAVLARLSASFVHVPTLQMPQAFQSSVDRLGRFLGLDHLVLFEVPPGESVPEVAASWTEPSRVAPTPWAARLMPWTMAQLRAGREVVVASLDGLPPEAAPDRSAFDARAVRAVVALPLVVGGRVVGGVACFGARGGSTWGDEVISRVRQASEVFGNALARKQTDGALRESESMKSAILAALPNAVAVLDGRGDVVAVNEEWQRAGEERDVAMLAGARSGSFVEHCHAAGAAGVSARDVIEGTEAVLAGTSAGLTVEYRARPVSLDRWFSVTVVPLGGGEGGAVVTHTEISARRRAEHSAQRSRDELAQVTRVSAMNELAASLAHQLNLPLTDIRSHAQTAQRLLAGGELNQTAMRGILEEIIADERRADLVIQRLRELLRKGPAERKRLDLNQVAQEVVALVESDVVVRNIHLTVGFSGEPLLVRGDRVHLAQALMNLITNAIEALDQVASQQRHLTVRSEAAYEAALIVITDNGPGPGTEPDRLFEPFFTTKGAAMGMGLPIARTVVEAHGGRLWLATAPATVGVSAYLSLPLDLP